MDKLSTRLQYPYERRLERKVGNPFFSLQGTQRVFYMVNNDQGSKPEEYHLSPLVKVQDYYDLVVETFQG